MGNRNNIYNWKCDRPSAFFAIGNESDSGHKDLSEPIRSMLFDFFGSEDFILTAAGGQGNHITYKATYAGEDFFIRIENGPEGDDYMEVESAIIKKVGEVGVPVPRLLAVDTSRTRYQFAYQIMEHIEYLDLNQIYKSGQFDLHPVMYSLGEMVARWQQINFDGYGLFNTEMLKRSGVLQGLLPSYRDYYTLNLERHIDFLVNKDFISRHEADLIANTVAMNVGYLDINRGCLVHKDLALWNVLGSRRHIEAVIDWDDAIMGDPSDDLALIACFHDGATLKPLLDGYIATKALPADFEPRFWLHLLRNMIMKAVIRVGAGYFSRNTDFFLIASATNGEMLREFTLNRIKSACRGLKGTMKIYDL